MGGVGNPEESAITTVFAKGGHLIRDEVVTIPEFGIGWRYLTTKVQGLPVRIRSIAHGGYVSSSPDGCVHHRKEAKEWEQFTLMHLGNGLVSFRTAHDRYLGAPDPADPRTSPNLVTKHSLREWEIFTLEHVLDERYALRTYHGTYICVDVPCHGQAERTVVANRAVAREWEHFDIELVEDLAKKGPGVEAVSDTNVGRAA